MLDMVVVVVKVVVVAVVLVVVLVLDCRGSSDECDEGMIVFR